MQQSFRMLVVDDSPKVRQAIVDIVSADGRFDVVGEASDGAEALRMAAQLRPDVISLDIIMPGMNGITALKHLMINNPTPTVMISSLTQEGAESTMEALRFGAVDFIPKPSKLAEEDIGQQGRAIVTKLEWAARVEIDAIRYIRAQPQSEKNGRIENPSEHVVAIGAGEGGYAALMKIVPHLDPHTAGCFVVVLYENGPNVNAFIDYLDRYSRVKVRRAQDGAPLLTGVCYIAAGEEYVTLRHGRKGMALHVHPAPFGSQRGSLNRVLYSAADMMAGRCTGVVLSGAGDDGMEGVEEIARVGGEVIIQDPRSCLVKEMAQNAAGQVAMGKILSDTFIASELNQTLSA